MLMTTFMDQRKIRNCEATEKFHPNKVKTVAVGIQRRDQSKTQKTLGVNQKTSVPLGPK